MIDISTFYLLFSSYEKCKCEIIENFVEFSFKVMTDSPHEICEIELKNFSLTLSDNDSATLFVEVDKNSGVVNRLDLINVQELNDMIADYTEDGEMHNFSFNLRIKKQSNGEIIPIYSLVSFLKYLSGLSLEKICGSFSGIIKRNAYFYLISDQVFLETASIIFSDNIVDEKKSKQIHRNETIRKRLEFANISGGDIFDIIPSDFYIIIKSSSVELNNLFNKICLQLCYVYLSNFTQLDDEKISYKMIGYKPISGEIKKDIAEISDETIGMYYNLQNWVYGDGSVADKGGLARNILSLYITQDNYTNIKENLYAYVLSCNELYIKENIDKYLEVKSSVIGLLNELNSKYMDTMDSFSGKIKNNLVAITSFYFTTLVLNTLSTGKISNIFTRDISIISYVFFLGSLLYLLASLYDYYKKYQRYEEYYYRQKSLYGELLVKGDIEELFLYDEPFRKDKKKIFWSALRNSLLWIIVSAILLYTVNYLSGYSIMQFISS